MANDTSGFFFGPGFDVSKMPKDSRAQQTIGVAMFCMVMGIIAVGLRLYTRLIMMRRVGIDDGMAVLSLIFLIALAVAQVYNVRSGLGTHIYLLDLSTPTSLVPFFKDLFFTVVFYNIALLWIKLTFLFQYYRVVAQVKNLRWGYVAAMFIIGGWTTAQIFVTIFSCTPVQKSWDFTVKGTCLNNPHQADINAIGNIVSDFIVLLLPLPVLFKLKLPRPQKFALVGIFCLGFFTCIISIARRASTNFTNDLTFSSAPTSSFSIAEISSGIVCAALPTLRPLLSKYFPSLTGTFTKFSEKVHNNKNGGNEKGYIPDYKQSSSDSSIYTSRPPTASTVHSARAAPGNIWANLFSPRKSSGLRPVREESDEDGGRLSPEVRGFLHNGTLVRHEEVPRKPVPQTQPFQMHVSQKGSIDGYSITPPKSSGGQSARSQLHKSLPPLPLPSPLPLPVRGAAGKKVIGGKEVGISWPVESLVRNPPPIVLAQPPRSRGRS